MRIIYGIFFTFSFLFSGAQKSYQYPALEMGADADTLHGVVVPDPYRILEDISNPITERWLNEQNEILKKYDRSLVLKEQLITQARIVSRSWHKNTEGFESEDEEEDEPKYTFAFGVLNAKKVPDVYMLERDLEGYTKLVDVSTFRKSREDNVLVSGVRMDEDEKNLAVMLSHSGSDWEEIFIYDLESRKQLNDTILNTLGQLYWKNDGFYYIAFKAPENEFSPRTHQTLNYHKLGTSQSDDLILFRNPDTTAVNPFHFYSLDEDQYLLNYKHERAGRVTNVSALVSITDDPTNFFMENFLSLPSTMEYSLSPEVVIGDLIFMRADIKSPNFKIVVCDKTKQNSIKEFIPEFEDKLINFTNLGDKYLACFYSLDATNSVLIYDLKGTLVKRIIFPKGNKITGLHAEEGDEYAYYWVRSFFRPTLRFRLNLKTWDSQRVTDITLPYDPEEFETRYVHYPSKDGTMVPMYVICRKDLKLDGKNPVLLYGYGGYGYTIEPRFKTENVLWLLNGGVLAIPNIRGGGAEGSEWAKAGRGLNKQNTIDDFIAAADFLIEKDYTNYNKLACMGGSHGGFIVGASITERPQLFKAAISIAGPFDMIRKSLFSSGAVDLNLKEYGDASVEEEFHTLLNFSPYHNVKEGVRYPETVLITGDSDNRVPPFHSYKFLAALQKNADEESQLLLKVAEGAGHNVTSTNETYYEDIAFRLHFLFDKLGMDIRMW